RPPPRTCPLLPYTTLFRSRLSQPLLRPGDTIYVQGEAAQLLMLAQEQALATPAQRRANGTDDLDDERLVELIVAPHSPYAGHTLDRKSTRLNSSHVKIPYA